MGYQIGGRIPERIHRELDWISDKHIACLHHYTHFRWIVDMVVKRSGIMPGSKQRGRFTHLHPFFVGSPSIFSALVKTGQMNAQP